ncbi:MNIO family bufferin maturase [Candidatus Accumulibacter aalborgensis]|uniref:MNIO family bufferin maturase n=1 Tax=Candidatus Accumulibacter aalborgensis TaxID=1860102 RepID=UPI001FDFB524|nr:DUF692 domain-containing protein [Candidatus Accumulibacter aalborgensis]
MSGGSLAEHLDGALERLEVIARTAIGNDQRASRGCLGTELSKENYFGAGGQPLHYLERIRAAYPISLHGVGLSLGTTDSLDGDHLRALRALIARIEPGLVSEHLCWSSVAGRHVNDLLPLPYTEEALSVVCAHVGEAQDAIGRQILVENVSSYLQFSHSTIDEWDFIAEVAARSGCAILLDINNIYVSAYNYGFDARRYLNAVPPSAVGELHLAGFDLADGLLIDTHGTRVADAVWQLYGEAVHLFGALPMLIEWDSDLPTLAVLLQEAATADRLQEERHALAA